MTNQDTITESENLIHTQLLDGDNPESIRQAAIILKEKGLVAFPTETVYGDRKSVV